MKVYTFSQARQELASVLDKANTEGQVRITRRDGQAFLIIPERPSRAPLDVKSTKVQLSKKTIVDAVRESLRPRR